MEEKKNDEELVWSENMVKQGINYSYTNKGNIYFSDTDGELEIDNRFLITLEMKLKGVPLQDGQRKKFERVSQAWLKAGLFDIAEYKESQKNTPQGPLPGEIKRLRRKAIIIKAVHNERDTDKLIPLHESMVESIYVQVEGTDYDMHWVDLDEPKNFVIFLDELINSWNIYRLKPNKKK